MINLKYQINFISENVNEFICFQGTRIKKKCLIEMFFNFVDDPSGIVKVSVAIYIFFKNHIYT